MARNELQIHDNGVVNQAEEMHYTENTILYWCLWTEMVAHK